MYRKLILSLIFAGIWYATPVVAHEMTPTYPKFVPSAFNGTYRTNMTIFNTRQDVEYFGIRVLDEEFMPVKFATRFKVAKIKYLQRFNFEIYIRKVDLKKAAYICSESVLIGNTNSEALVESKICSKIYRGE